MTARWAPVVGYEGLYEVSDGGHIRSVGRHYSPGRRGTPQRWKPQRLLAPDVTHKGYLAVRLYNNGRHKTFLIHRLVLIAFVGPPPEGTECCHNNGQRTDNRLVNLRWDSPSANASDQFKHGTQRNAFRTHCIHGHEFTPENTYQLIQGGRPRRICKACCRDRSRARRLSRKVLA